MGERWILAVDFGNGGPKVAAVTLSGELIRTALRPVSVHVGLDGAATQDATEWWSQLLEAVREVVDTSGVDRDALHAVAITGQWASTVTVDEDGLPTGPVLLWADTRARPLVKEILGGPVSVSGYAPHKVLPFIRATAGAPTPSGADPTGHSMLLQRRMREVYDATAVLLEPVDYLGMRF